MSDRSRGAVFAALLFAGLPAGCGVEPGRAGAVERDSAGVMIVENGTRVWGEGQAWQVEPIAMVDIGGGGLEFERIAGVAFRSDGGLVVGDEGASTLYAFDGAGDLVWRTGRPGDGPGEFRLIASLGVMPGDTSWVFDFGSRRFTLLDATGRVGRTIDLTVPASAPRAIASLDDGTFIVQEMWGRAGTADATGMRRDPAAVLRVSADGASADTIALVPGREVWITVEDGRGVMNTPLFSRNSAVAAAGDRILVGDQASYAIDAYDPAGTHRRSIRRTGQDLSIGEGAVRRAIEGILEDLPDAERPARRRFLESVPIPESRPAFDRLLIAATGEIWVSDSALDPADAEQWNVFGTNGHWLGMIALPPSFRLEAVSTDRIAGVWRSELDVEYVRTYGLTKPAGQSAR
jgi:outer membrane protein assembly factor BamB